MTPWDHPGFSLPVVAAAIGPFATPSFLSVVDRYEEGEPLLASSESGFLVLRRVGDEIRFSGDPEITDYHSPLGHGIEALIGEVAAEAQPERFVLDSLPDEAAQPLVAGLEGAGWMVETTVEEVAAVVDLPATFDRYLESIGKKERHEMRRKRRRYQRVVGDVHHETQRGEGWGLDELIRLHRLAEGEKGEFMTSEREELFVDLARLDGWRLDLLCRGQDTAVAVVFGWSDPSGYYLYNSAYDPGFSDASPGAVLLGTMIEQAITESTSRFDFLKGAEPYKFRLGATERPLTKIVATPGGA